MINRRPSSPSLLLVLVLFLISISTVRSRFILSSDPVSDGLDPSLDRRYPLYFPLWASSDSCDETYGFMPCTSTWIGNLFLILVYGCLMYMAATFLSTGSEMMLEILGPGLIGGLLLPTLGALDDPIVILVSGLSGSTETAQSQVSVGMGLLAGSTVMLLTVAWGSCVLAGKCDLGDSGAVDKVDTKGFSLTGSGVTTDRYTSHAAKIMIISVIPFIVVQLLPLINSTSGRHVEVLIALILSVVLLISYCLYQVFHPWIQRRKLEYAEHRHFFLGFLIHVKRHALGRLMADEDEVDPEILDGLFETIDENNDGYLTAGELKAFLVGIRFEETDLDQREAVDKIMADFDTSDDNLLSKEEFKKGIEKWAMHAVRSGQGSCFGNFGTTKSIHDAHRQAKEEHEQLLKADPSGEAVEGVENAKMTTLKAVGLMFLGTVIAAAFAELYGAVTIHNLLCIAVFLALVYIRGLTWDFTSEVIVILIVCILMGSFAGFRTTFPLWTAPVAFVLYPLSLALVYVLDYVVGWS